MAFRNPVLHAPGEFFDFFALSDLTSGEFFADFGSTSIVLRAFYEHPASVRVTAFGDGTLSSFASAAVFTGDESEEGHEFSGMRKAPEVAEFTDDGHGSDFLESFTGH